MKRLQELTKQINIITQKIEEEYPELYQYLDENPINIPENQGTKLTIKNFSDYLESLKQILEGYIESHNLKK